MTTDYQKTLIYKLVCRDDSVKDFYIGSTTNIQNRLRAHRLHSKQKDWKIYKIINEYGGFSNWKDVIIEHYPCNSKKEANEREQYYIEKLKPSLNTQVAFKTEEDYKNRYVKYYNSKRDEIVEKKKKLYYDNYEHNRKIINERDRKRYVWKSISKEFLNILL